MSALACGLAIRPCWPVKPALHSRSKSLIVRKKWDLPQHRQRRSFTTVMQGVQNCYTCNSASNNALNLPVGPVAAFFDPLVSHIPSPIGQALVQAFIDVMWPIAAAYMGVTVMNWLAARARKFRDDVVYESQVNSSAYVWSWLPLSLAPPLSVFLPMIAFITTISNVSAVVDRLHHCRYIDVPDWMDKLVHHTAFWLEVVNERLIDFTTIGCMVFFTWVFIQWKELKVKRYLQQKQNQDLENILIPASAILDWCLVALTVLASCSVLGFDLRPLLAVGGVGSLIVGFSAQALLANAISGLSIFLSRPFIPGERITCVGSGGITVAGTVVQVEPVRTVILTDDGVPVRIPNKLIADLVIYNESRTSDGLLDSITWRGQGQLSRRLLRAQIKLSPGHASDISDLMLKLEQYLQSSNAVDILRGMSVALEGMNEKGYDIMVRVTLMAGTIAEQKRQASDLFVGISKIAAEHNAVTITLPGVK